MGTLFSIKLGLHSRKRQGVPCDWKANSHSGRLEDFESDMYLEFCAGSLIPRYL